MNKSVITLAIFLALSSQAQASLNDAESNAVKEYLAGYDAQYHTNEASAKYNELTNGANNLEEVNNRLHSNSFYTGYNNGDKVVVFDGAIISAPDSTIIEATNLSNQSPQVQKPIVETPVASTNSIIASAKTISISENLKQTQAAYMSTSDKTGIVGAALRDKMTSLSQQLKKSQEDDKIKSLMAPIVASNNKAGFEAAKNKPSSYDAPPKLVSIPMTSAPVNYVAHNDPTGTPVNYARNGNLVSQIHGVVIEAPDQMKVTEITQSTPVAVPSKQPVAIPNQNPQIKNAIPTPEITPAKQLIPVAPQQVPQATPHINLTPVYVEQKTPDLIPQINPQKVPVKVASVDLIPRKAPKGEEPAIFQKTPSISATTYRKLVNQAQAAVMSDANPLAQQDTTKAHVGINGKNYRYNVTEAQAKVMSVSSVSSVETIHQTASALPEIQAMTLTASTRPVVASKPALKPVVSKTTQSVNNGATKGDVATLAEAHNVNVEAINQNHRAITSTAHQVADNSQAISKMNNSFSSLKDEVGENRKEANAGIAGAMAVAGLPQVNANQKFMVSAGAGTFNGESAVAVGASVNVNDNVVIKAGVSDDTENNFGGNVGVGFGF
ncbi:YadA C-terminal domain-containing protein [Enterobacter cloacae]|uniref:YadA C-terminal domain-containing protein n=1 Tax=Enterobacter cloacae TaxID=550 RepID=UPI002435FAFB|nr:YadA C-terminal domain-containing protein [Enterobacter cloacae]